MSRTKKDMPHWVTAKWYEPFHNCGWRRLIVRMDWREEDFDGRVPPENSRSVYQWKYLGDCDLPVEPVVQDSTWYRRKNQPTRCFWVAQWPPQRYYQTRGVRDKRLWRRVNFYGPQRTAERMAAREVIKGNVNYEYPDGRGRHSVLWDLW